MITIVCPAYYGPPENRSRNGCSVSKGMRGERSNDQRRPKNRYAPLPSEGRRDQWSKDLRQATNEQPPRHLPPFPHPHSLDPLLGVAVLLFHQRDRHAELFASDRGPAVPLYRQHYRPPEPCPPMREEGGGPTVYGHEKRRRLFLRRHR